MPVRPRRLEGRKCLIVGGTGGIGLASARRFLEEGARVVIAGRDPSGAEVMDPLRHLGPCAGWSIDVSNASEVESLFENAIGFLNGRLDVLFHVAGISGRRLGDGTLDAC